MKQLNHYETLEKMIHLNIDFIIYAYNISKQNLSLILRSADIFGVKTIYYDNSLENYNKKYKKLTQNSKIPIIISHGPKTLLKLKKDGFDIVALEITDSSIAINQTKFNKKICLIVGNENYGIPQEILNLVDYACHIEMIGKHISSLNVAVASSIAMYEISQFYLKNNKNSIK